MKNPRDSRRPNTPPASRPSHKVLILDTNVLLCWLNVPGFNTAGTLTHESVTAELKKEKGNGTMLIIPYVAIIEVGTNITRVGNNRAATSANKFIEILEKAKEYTINETIPPPNTEYWWRLSTVSEIIHLFSPETILETVKEWLQRGLKNQFRSIPSVADLSIRQVCEFYKQKRVFEVEVYSTDEDLNRYLEQHKIQIKRS